MSVQVSYKKQFTIFFVLFLIIIVMAEVSLHAIPQQIECKFIENKLFENIKHKQEMCKEYTNIEYSFDSPIREIVEQQGTFININSDGFRGKEIDHTHTQKIVFLGGSTIFGKVTTSDTTTIPGFTQKLLDENYDVEVINAGIPSASTIDEIYLLEEKILPLKPKIVVMYDGWNDIEYADRIKNSITYEKFKQNDYFTNNQKNDGDDSRLKSKLKNFLNSINFKIGLGIVQFYDDFYGITLSKDAQNDVSKIDNAHLAKIKQNLFKNWNYACDLGEKNNFDIIIILHPMLNSGDRKPHFDELQIMDDPRINVNYYLNNIDLKDFDTCQNIHDFRYIFDNSNELLFFDIGHVTDNGNKIIANQISKIIIDLNLLK
ncbi:MAG: hypothetical protein CL763_10355 [Chloroflexi bacterium]|nr:hypothetical protein [Chloroflexota bacterium]|tara:strand:+ start:2333 stop:3454 length:1122 start_codon:yes stop_codon:yes gene_type:complete